MSKESAVFFIFFLFSAPHFFYFLFVILFPVILFLFVLGSNSN
jgi:hypothetical protein